MAVPLSTEAIRTALQACDIRGLPIPPRCSALLELGEMRIGVAITRDEIDISSDVGINGSWDFAYSLTTEEWVKFCAPVPARGFTSAQAIVATQGSDRVRGSRPVWAQVAPILDMVLDRLRKSARTSGVIVNPAPPHPSLGISDIEGRYVTIPTSPPSRLYFEAAGQGQPLVCLHTAGSDSRQFRHVLEDRGITQKYRVFAFDMPWHGRSDPPDSWATQKYELTTKMYSETILAFCDALQLESPLLMGCSIGGAICLYMSSVYGDRFGGVIALEGGLGNPGRWVDWTKRLDVDHSTFLTSWVGGLMAPSAPSGPRSQTLWHYAQSGPSVYNGDTYFFSVDFPKYVPSLRKATCPLVLLTGDYDYSATTEMSQKAADLLGGMLVIMKGHGHFPMSEDPLAFRRYLMQGLEMVQNAQA